MLFFSVGKNNPIPSWTIARILFYVLLSFPWSLCALLYLRFWSLKENTQCSWYDHGKISCSFCLITFHSMFTWTILPMKLPFGKYLCFVNSGNASSNSLAEVYHINTRKLLPSKWLSHLQYFILGNRTDTLILSFPLFGLAAFWQLPWHQPAPSTVCRCQSRN